LLEEVEWIRTTDPVFETYLEILAAMLGRRGNKLYVGPLLETIPDPVGPRRRSSQIATIAPSSWQAARMFLMNLRVWRDEPFVERFTERRRLTIWSPAWPRSPSLGVRVRSSGASDNWSMPQPHHLVGSDSTSLPLLYRKRFLYTAMPRTPPDVASRPFQRRGSMWMIDSHSRERR
jgi:hypothetical protein